MVLFFTNFDFDLEARMQHVDIDDREYIESGISITLREIWIGDVDEKSVNKLIRAISLMEMINDEPITICISSNGGDVVDGLALYDKLRNSPCQITTMCIGKVASMGLVLFLAGDERLATKNSSFMAHEVATSMEGKIQDVQIITYEIERLNAALVDILVERTKKKKGFWLKKINNVDFYFNYDEALELNICTKIE